jgi:hypothetical protein
VLKRSNYTRQRDKDIRRLKVPSYNRDPEPSGPHAERQRGLWSRPCRPASNYIRYYACRGNCCIFATSVAACGWAESAGARQRTNERKFRSMRRHAFDVQLGTRFTIALHPIVNTACHQSRRTQHQVCAVQNAAQDSGSRLDSSH